jgi:hypothetical protein
LLDIPRLCRALAIPGEIASQFLEAENSKMYLYGLDKVKYTTDQISDVLGEYLSVKHNKSSKLLIASNLTSKQRKAICDDVNELAVYSKMYYDIDSVKSDPLIRGEYPYGNPFDHIIDIMNYGAIIIRFKYVSRNSSLPPEEKIVSYHVMRVKEKYVLGLHMQADKTFSMYKQWGKGDHMLTPIYPEYQNTIVRWGKEDVTKAVLEHDNKRQYNSNKEEFLY